MIKSICIVRLSALGDVLMLVPLVRTLQDHFPQARITWVISPMAHELVSGMDGVEFIVIDKPQNMRDYWHFYQQMKRRHFDVLLATQASFRANLLYALISATRKIGYDKLRAKDGHSWFIKESIKPGSEHTLEGFLKFAEPLGITPRSIRWDLPIAENDYAWARQFTANKPHTLLVNPSASKPERSWKAERYAAVIRYAQSELNMQVILTGGPGAYDQALASEILTQVDCLSLVGKTRPKQLLALISQAQLMLCPDTGPSHMATAMGTPVLALHATTSPEVSGPYHYKQHAVNYYPEAVETLLHRALANTPWGTHVHHPEAMLLIPVDVVIERLKTLYRLKTLEMHQ